MSKGTRQLGLAALLLLAATPVLLNSCVSPPPVDGPLRRDPAAPVIDMHVHVAGLGHGGSGAFVSAAMRDNFRFPFYLWAMGVDETALEAGGDRILFLRLSRLVGESAIVDAAVVLAIDGVVGSDGQLDRAATQVYIPNDYVARETAGFDNLLFGASVNPYRPDALERLERAREAGAVLVKWIPSIMAIDPADPRITPFYRKMAALKLPLLTHTGMEKAFAGARDELADPRRLVLPLSLGVTVIAAHVATTGESEGEDNFARILPMFAEYPNLYADISSLTQLNKRGYLAAVMERPELHDRLVYGTDWPLQFFPLVSPWYHVTRIGLENAARIGRIDNVWDRDVALKRAFGVPDAVLTRFATMLPVPPGAPDGPAPATPRPRR